MKHRRRCRIHKDPPGFDPEQHSLLALVLFNLLLAALKDSQEPEKLCKIASRRRLKSN